MQHNLLSKYRTPFTFFPELMDSSKKIFYSNNFITDLNNICKTNNFYLIEIDFQEYYKDEINFPILFSDKNSIFTAFKTFNDNPYEFTIENNFRVRMIGDTLNIFDKKINEIDKTYTLKKENVENWKLSYENFFKLVWLIDEYFFNGKFNFPMGLRKLFNPHPILGKLENKLVIHPGGSRQIVTKLFGNKEKFIIYEEDKLKLLENFITKTNIINNYDSLEQLLNQKIDLHNSFIIGYNTNGYSEYEFNINAYNQITYSVSNYSKDWFKKYEKLNKIQVKGDEKQKYFFSKLANYWMNKTDSLSYVIYQKINFVENFDECADIKITLGKNKIIDILMIPYLFSLNYCEITGYDGFHFLNKLSDKNLVCEFNGFKENDYFVDLIFI